MSNESETYELFVQKLYEGLLGAKVTVHHHKTYTGRISGRDIVVDVSFEYDFFGAKVLFIVECKCYGHSVPVDDVEEFQTKLNDIGAQKGVMVTTVGYQEGAIKTAKGYRIALALLTNKPQKGEMTFVVNADMRQAATPAHEFWQGNLRASLGRFEGGYRFDGVHQFLSILCMDEWDERKKDDPLFWLKHPKTGA